MTNPAPVPSVPTPTPNVEISKIHDDIREKEDNIAIMKAELKALQEGPDSIHVKDPKKRPGFLTRYFLHLAGKDSSLYTYKEAWQHGKLAPAGRNIAFASFLFADAVAYIAGYIPAAANALSEGDLQNVVLLKTAAVIGAVYYISSEIIDSGMYKRLRKVREEKAAYLKGLREGGEERLKQITDPSERIKVKIENEKLHVQEAARVYGIYGSAAMFTLVAAMIIRQGDINEVLDKNEVNKIEDIRADIENRYNSLGEKSEGIRAKIKALDAEIRGDASELSNSETQTLKERVNSLQEQLTQLEKRKIEEQGFADRESSGLGTYVDENGETQQRKAGKSVRYREHIQNIKDINGEIRVVEANLAETKGELKAAEAKIQDRIDENKAERAEGLAGTKANLEAQLAKLTEQVKNFGDIEELVKNDSRYPDASSPLSPAEQIDAFFKVALPDSVGKGLLLGATGLIGLLSYNTEMAFLKSATDNNVEDIELREIRHEIAKQRKEDKMTSLHEEIVELEVENALKKGELEAARLEELGTSHALELLKEQRRRNSETLAKLVKIQQSQKSAFETILKGNGEIAQKIRTDGLDGAVTDPKRRELLADLLEESTADTIEVALRSDVPSEQVGVNDNNANGGKTISVDLAQKPKGQTLEA